LILFLGPGLGLLAPSMSVKTSESRTALCYCTYVCGSVAEGDEGGAKDDVDWIRIGGVGDGMPSEVVVHVSLEPSQRSQRQCWEM
jgi:hypothetical protein